MHEWEAWLSDVSNRTLPGGVAVGALAAAMGAALVTKALRVTLSRGRLSPGEKRRFEAAAAAAREAQAALLGLAEADEVAFRRVLTAGKGSAASDERRNAWRMATDIPVSVAETSRDLLERLPPLHESCLPAVLVDLEIGTRLLLAGQDAGVRAARANLREWEADPDSGTLAPRLEALEQEPG